MLTRVFRISVCVMILVLAAGMALPTQAAPAALGQAALIGMGSNVTAITLNPPSPNILANGINVAFTATYTSDYPAGVVINLLPFSAGVPTPNASATVSMSGSPSSGTVNGTFTVTTGEATVDQLRIQIKTANTNSTLQTLSLPVFYQFTASANRVSNLRFSPGQTNIITPGEQVTLTFNYAAANSGGIVVTAQPLSGGVPTSGAVVTDSGSLATGSGSNVTASFNVPLAPGAADITVDQLEIKVTNPSKTTTFADTKVPVNYIVANPTTIVNANATTIVNDITLSTANPNIFHSGQTVSLTFKYATTATNGLQIVVIPYAAGAAINGGSYTPSLPLYTGASGNGGGTFTINGYNVLVGGLLVEAFNASKTVVLFKKVIPVHYQYTGLTFVRFMPVIAR